METDHFDYPLPEDRIAQQPVEPRDASRLLDTRDLTDHRFRDLPALLRPGDLVVVNHTRVRHARLLGARHPTGGRVEGLVLRRLDADRWELLLKPSRRLRAGSRIRFGDIDACLVTDPRDGVAEVTMRADTDVEDALTTVGEVPLPPYITATLEDPGRYQTIFADRPGSAAAPTAGLHFTEGVVAALHEAGVETTAVELQVGIGTFRPITAERVEDHRMHAEAYSVTAEASEAIRRCRQRGGRVVAVGTTVVRTLETVGTDDGTVAEGSGSTGLYITPGFRFRVVDLLITNYHLPRSSLLVLVAAFMGDRWRDAYQAALDRGYRFASFGDAMLCERER